jgi:predicted nucleic acid-binding protein
LIIIDTNVLSELMRAEPSPRVRAWTDGRVAEELWTTTISVMELLQGQELLPHGKRRSQLAERLDTTLHEDFAGQFMISPSTRPMPPQ